MGNINFSIKQKVALINILKGIEIVIERIIMGTDVPCYIADCQIDEKNVFLSSNIEKPNIYFCPGCFKAALYVKSNGKYYFLECEEEFFDKEYFFQKETTFKKHLSTCSNGFKRQNNLHIFEVATKKQQSMILRIGQFSQWAQGLDSAMTNEKKFSLGNFSVFVFTHDFLNHDRYKKIPIGYISVMMKYNDKLVKEIPVIEDIFVFKRFRRRGIATELLDYVVQEYKIKKDIGAQLEIADSFQSILKKRFDSVWGYLGIAHGIITL